MSHPFTASSGRSTGTIFWETSPPPGKPLGQGVAPGGRPAAQPDLFNPGPLVQDGFDLRARVPAGAEEAEDARILPGQMADRKRRGRGRPGVHQEIMTHDGDELHPVVVVVHDEKLRPHPVIDVLRFPRGVEHPAAVVVRVGPERGDAQAGEDAGEDANDRSVLVTPAFRVIHVHPAVKPEVSAGLLDEGPLNPVGGPGDNLRLGHPLEEALNVPLAEDECRIAFFRLAFRPDHRASLRNV